MLIVCMCMNVKLNLLWLICGSGNGDNPSNLNNLAGEPWNGIYCFNCPNIIGYNLVA
jgi:hypothetical protein